MSPADSSPQDGYRIERFGEQDAVSVADVVALWTSEGELSPAEAERRMSELLLVAIDGRRELAGVCTAYLAPSRQLRTDMWHFRVFVPAAHRQANVAIALAVGSRDLLRHRYVSGEDRSAIGIIYEVESEILKRQLSTARWRHTGAVFIGENARGDHVRVQYFPGALAPEPDQGST